MKFEKIDDNKLKIILNISDLSEQNVDFHSFMANPLQSQKLFNILLDLAEKKVGFITKNYDLRIEALSLPNADFVITLTKLMPKTDKEHINSYKIRPFKIKKRHLPKSSGIVVYCFDFFDDFCDFSGLFNKMNFSKTNKLYYYNEKYYLVIETLNIDNCKNYKFYSMITEFATYIHDSDIFSKQLSEYGKIIINKNAVNTINKFFIKKIV